MRIFISSRFKELENERRYVKDHLEDEKHKVFIFEDDAGARTEKSSKVYKDEVLKCDIYIGIFKFLFSSPTEEEYDLAFEQKKEIFIYVFSEQGDREEKLGIFLKKLKDRHTYEKFVSKEDLVTKIKEHILSLLLRTYRIRSHQRSDLFDNLERENLMLLDNSTTFTNADFNCWKLGYFSEGDVHLNYDARRPITDNILDSISTNKCTMIYGKPFAGKSLILKRISKELIDQGYAVLFVESFQTTKGELLKIISNLSREYEKLLIIADNCHLFGSDLVFEVFNHITSDNDKIKFLLSARREEFDKLIQSFPFNKSSEVKRCISNSNIIALNFELMDSIAYITKVNQLYDLKKESSEITSLSRGLFEKSNGDPWVFYYMLMATLSNNLIFNTNYHDFLMRHYNEVFSKVNSNDIPFTFLCCFIDYCNIPLTLRLISELNYTSTNLENLQKISFLFKDTNYKTRHPVWAREYMLYIIINKYDRNYSVMENEFRLQEKISLLIQNLSFIHLMQIIHGCNFLFSITEFRYFCDMIIKTILDQIKKGILQNFTKYEIVLVYSLGLAQYHFSTNNYTEAIQLCKTARCIDAVYPEPWFKLGYIYDETGQNIEALNCYDRSIDINSEYTDPWFNKGGLFQHEFGNIEEAILSFKKVLIISPMDYEAWFSLGQAQQENQQPDEAMKSYNESLTKNPRYDPAWFDKGIILFEEQKYEQARSCFDKVIEYSVDPVLMKGSLRNNGIICDILMNYREAIRYYSKFLRLEPRNLEIIYKVSIDRLRTKDILEGIFGLRQIYRLKRGELLNAINQDSEFRKFEGYEKIKMLFP